MSLLEFLNELTYLLYPCVPDPVMMGTINASVTIWQEGGASQLLGFSESILFRLKS